MAQGLGKESARPHDVAAAPPAESSESDRHEVIVHCSLFVVEYDQAQQPFRPTHDLF